MDDPPRHELSDFLRTRRARLTPGEVGLPAPGGRRGPGLRREDVAVLAGVGLTWYTWLEQGRDIQVSTAFLESLARALRLSEAERSHLFALAQRRPPPAAPASALPQALEQVQAILDAIDSPAFARNTRFDVIAWNAANREMFGDFAAVPKPERNVIRLMFLRPHYRHTMPDWEADARGLVAKLRLSYGQAAGDAGFSAFVQAMLGLSADFRRLWAEHAVSDVGEGVTTYRSARHGTVVFRHSTLVPEGLPELRIVVYIPSQPA